MAWTSTLLRSDVAIGPPWRQDEKFAMLVAWLALATREVPRIESRASFFLLTFRLLFADNDSGGRARPWLLPGVRNRFTTLSPASWTRTAIRRRTKRFAEGLGLSSLATVHKHISNLEQKELLRRDYNRSRSIDLLKPRGRMKQAFAVAAAAAAESSLSLPLLGRIAAGRPLEALENPESISLSDFTRSKDVYVLQVTGESMQDEHIVNGDYVLVEKANAARDGEIVVALVNGSDATLKRIYVEGSKVRLQPSTRPCSPLSFPPQRCKSREE